MRVVLVLLLAALPSLAQGLGAPVRVDTWKSAHNRKRLRLEWEGLPEYKPTKLPDGSEEPPEAPWPFLLYVQQVESKTSEKAQEWVFEDARFVLAAHAVKVVRIKPHKAVDLPYLAATKGIKDPTFILVDRKFKVRAVFNKPNDFKANKVLGPMVKLADEEYQNKLSDYVKAYLDLLKDGEKLWKEEQALETLATRAGEKDKAKAKEMDQEIAEREKALADQMGALTVREEQIRGTMRIKTKEAEAIPTSIGSGKSKRKLTPQELEAIETFRQFARDSNPVVRAAAVEDLGAIDSAVMVEAILDASNDVDPRVVEAAGMALGRMKSAEALEAMQAALASGNAKAKQATLFGFGAIEKPYPAALPQIVPFLEASDEDTRRAAIRAVENQKDASAAKALLPLLDDRVPALRVMTATALGNLRAPDAAKPLIELLTASDWSLKKAAAEALAKIRVKESIEPLITRFEQEEGLMLEVLYQALVAITGQDFRYRTEGWRKWWERYGPSFKIPTEQEIEVARQKAREALRGYAKPDKRKYHKIETLSRKMIFIIDISSSMKDKIVIPPDAPPAAQEEFPDRVKMEIAKKELIDLLATLDANVYFDIITFAGNVKSWKGTLVSGTARTSAIKYVSKLEPIEAPRAGRRGKVGGGEEQKTNTYAAMMAAFGLADAAIPDWRARTQVDTIFLVTDGLPTTGKVTEVPKLIREITELNRSRGVVIHLITFDKIAARRLGPLATNNGGQVVLRGF